MREVGVVLIGALVYFGGRLVVEGLNGTEINGRDRAFKAYVSDDVRIAARMDRVLELADGRLGPAQD